MEANALFSANILDCGSSISRVELLDGTNLVEHVVRAIPDYQEKCTIVVKINYKNTPCCHAYLCNVDNKDAFGIEKRSSLPNAKLLLEWSDKKMLGYREKIPKLDELLNSSV